MTAKQALNLVIGLMVMTFLQACLKAIWSSFPFAEACGFEWGGLATILATKTANDVAEMRTGIAAAKMAAQAAPCAPTPAP